MGKKTMDSMVLEEIDALQKNAEVKEQIKQLPKKIDEAAVRKASEILKKYKRGKARLEEKIVANEQFWKLRQWSYMNDGKDDFKPATAWLWSCIQSRYSDVMDSFPTCNILPRQRDDKAEAQKLSSIIPIILAQNDYEGTYSDVSWYTLKQGGGVQGVFWDGTKHNGLGDVAIRKIDFINLFWEPGITDIQESENVFHTSLVSNKVLEQTYPQTKDRLGGKGIALAKYIYDDNVDTSDKSIVVDWYYHTYVNGKKTLQFAKFVKDIVLYATENDILAPTMKKMDETTGVEVEVPTGEPSMAERGLYDHALYPFVVQCLFPVEGNLCGYGLTDIGRDAQIQIDKLNKAIMDNAIAGAKPRYLSKMNGGINEEEFADTNKDIVHVEGNLSDDNIRPIENAQLPSIYVNILNNKIEELKYCTSNQDSNNGVAPSGITAASAIAALQETAGKNARSANKTFHRGYREVVYQVIELVRQFYDVPRTFRICPDSTKEEFVTFSNAGIVAQKQSVEGVDTGYRLPEFDIEVTTEKASPYKKMEVNELALGFYKQGFFNPQMADQALACLEMMDFQHKNEVIQRIQANGTIMQQLLEMQQIALRLAQQVDPALADQIAQAILSQGGMPMPAGGEITLDVDKEHPIVERARNEARASTEGE